MKIIINIDSDEYTQSILNAKEIKFNHILQIFNCLSIIHLLFDYTVILYLF